MGFFFELTAMKVLALMGIYLIGAARPVEMATPTVRVVDSNHIAVSCRLRRPLTDDLRKILESGTTVTVAFRCEITGLNLTRSLPHIEILHTINLVEDDYRIETPREVFRVPALSHRIPLFRLDEAKLWGIDQLPEGPYQVTVTAYLKPITVRATGRTFDLMALWNFERPRETSLPVVVNRPERVWQGGSP